MDTDIVTEILASINFQDLTALVIAGGLAIIGLSFLGFVVAMGLRVANGRQAVGPDSDKNSEFKDSEDAK